MIEVHETLTQKVAELARLELSASEVSTFTGQLREILKYVDQLMEVNVTLKDGQAVEPLTHPLDLATPFREDQVIASPTDEQGKPKVLRSAPEVMYEGYKVPPIL